MARLRNLRVGAINIAIANKKFHNAESYSNLLEALFDLRHPQKMRGEQRLLLGALGKGKDPNTLQGIVDRYIELDNFHWYNSEERRPASDAEMRRIVIPAALEANHREYPFYFSLKDHRLAFLVSDIGLKMSPRQMCLYFERLVNEAAIIKIFGSVSVSIEQEPGALNLILNSSHLKELTITVNRPNPDSIGGLDALFGKRLASQRAKRAVVQIQADESDSLKPDTTIKKLARVASSNGEVRAKVNDGGTVREVSSSDFPLLVSLPYSEKTFSSGEAFLRAARAIVDRVMNRG